MPGLNINELRRAYRGAQETDNRSAVPDSFRARLFETMRNLRARLVHTAQIEDDASRERTLEEQHAERNIREFVNSFPIFMDRRNDAHEASSEQVRYERDPHHDRPNQFAYGISYRGRTILVNMPGKPLDEVRSEIHEDETFPRWDILLEKIKQYLSI